MPSSGSADFTILREARLVARIVRGPGAMHRAGRRGATSETGTALAYADVEVFSAQDFAPLLTLAQAALDLDAFLFKLKLEGYEVRDGEPVIRSTFRKF